MASKDFILRWQVLDVRIAVREPSDHLVADELLQGQILALASKCEKGTKIGASRDKSPRTIGGRVSCLQDERDIGSAVGQRAARVARRQARVGWNPLPRSDDSEPSTQLRNPFGIAPKRIPSSRPSLEPLLVPFVVVVARLDAPQSNLWLLAVAGLAELAFHPLDGGWNSRTGHSRSIEPPLLADYPPTLGCLSTEHSQVLGRVLDSVLRTYGSDLPGDLPIELERPSLRCPSLHVP